MVLWTLTPTEVVSAIRRLVREGAVSDALAEDAEARAEEHVAASHLVVNVESVIPRPGSR